MSQGSHRSCIFCQIVAGQAPCHRVFEDDDVLAFMDIQPVSEGHTLVIPKVHYENLFEATPDAMAEVARVSVPIARAIRSVLAPDGVFAAQANGAAAGQTVFHYHLHLIPRWQGRGLQLLHGRKAGEPEALAGVAERLREALRGTPD